MTNRVSSGGQNSVSHTPEVECFGNVSVFDDTNAQFKVPPIVLNRGEGTGYGRGACTPGARARQGREHARGAPGV